MALNDRVRVGDGYTWDNSVTIPVYEVMYKPNGDLLLDSYGAVTLKRLGGVKGGTTGLIAGGAVKAHKNQIDFDTSTASMGVDLVVLFPIRLDHYGKTVYIATNNMRVLGGSTG